MGRDAVIHGVWQGVGSRVDLAQNGGGSLMP